MTHFADDLYLGNAKSKPTVSNPANLGWGFGPCGRTYSYDILPLTLNAAAYAASQSPLVAGNLTLAAGTGVTATTDPGGNVAYAPDYPRAVSITSGGVDTARTFTVYGYDYLGRAQTEAITGSSSTVAYGKKAFASIWKISVDAATASTVTAGTTDIFGLPVAITDKGYVLHVGCNSVLANDTGTFTVADATTATSTTGDVRGTYLPSVASSGSVRTVITVALKALQVGPSATFAGLYGVTPA